MYAASIVDERLAIAAQTLGWKPEYHSTTEVDKFTEYLKQWEDRKMIMQHEGYAPIPKTQVVNVQGDVNTDNRQQSVSIGSLNKIDTLMGEITDRFNERLSIGDGRNSSARQITETAEAVEANSDIIDGNNIIDSGSAIGNIVEIPELADGSVVDSSIPDRTENGSEWEVDL